MPYSVSFPWQVPGGVLSFSLDSLGSVFLLAVVLLVGCAGVYGAGYMRQYRGKKPLGLHVFFYLLLTLALVVIITANNAILFLGAWETMSIATYFLIVFDDENPAVQRAGFLYLAAAHCGTFLLFIMFFLMGHAAGSMNFDVISRAGFDPVLSGVLVVLALAGFGVKAGLVPLHIWLPHAHPAAPSHVSALLSGVAIKTGIYGICRVLWMLDAVPGWCGYLFLAVGAMSGIMGVLYALGQHELKRLLAYHSIENIGIIMLGLGLGLLGRAHGMPFLAGLGFTGALLHVVNHSIFKGLLFLNAGVVIRSAGTGELDCLGGLAKTMPVTAGLFLIGALSICGLPLFNGFISELIIYRGFFLGLTDLPLSGAVACALGVLALAFMGTLALACFVKVYAAVFSGEPRTPRNPAEEKDPANLLMIPMLFLAGLCCWIGLAPETMTQLALNGGAWVAHLEPRAVDTGALLLPVSVSVSAVLMLLIVVGVLWGIRSLLTGKEPHPVRTTWACGFSQTLPRAQYTSASFARPILELLKSVVLFRRSGGNVAGDFPVTGVHAASSVDDASEESLFRPGFRRLVRLSRKIDEQRIRYTQMYLMYIFLFLIFLLVWKLR